MNPAVVHTLLQLSPDPVVYNFTGLRSGLLVGQGVGATKSGASWVNSCTVFHAPYGQEHCSVDKCHTGPVTALVNMTETGVFYLRYLNINNSTVNKYFLTKLQLFQRHIQNPVHIIF